MIVTVVRVFFEVLGALMFAAICLVALVAFAEEWHTWRRRRALEDAECDALREPGMGHLGREADR